MVGISFELMLEIAGGIGILVGIILFLVLRNRFYKFCFSISNR